MDSNYTKHVVAVQGAESYSLFFEAGHVETSVENVGKARLQNESLLDAHLLWM